MKKIILFLGLTTLLSMSGCTNSGKSDQYGNSEDKSGNSNNSNNAPAATNDETGSPSGDQTGKQNGDLNNQNDGQGTGQNGNANGNQNLPGDATKVNYTNNPRPNPDTSSTYDNSKTKKGTGKEDPK